MSELMNELTMEIAPKYKVNEGECGMYLVFWGTQSRIRHVCSFLPHLLPMAPYVKMETRHFN